MSKLVIEGGRKLHGEMTVHGAKNSALPILAACAAVNGECLLTNCPALTDTDTAIGILNYLGCRAKRVGSEAYVDGSGVGRFEIPERMMREMRSSISFLGPVLARCGRVELSLPGGCELGARPVDLHLEAMARLGAQVEERRGTIVCTRRGRLRGADIPLSFPSVGATENIMAAAATADGTTVVTNAAREPEIADMGAFLNRCGARIRGCGQSTIVIEGVEELHGCSFAIMPDRIEAATYMAATAAAGGRILLRGVVPEHLAPVTLVLERMGCVTASEGGSICITAPERLRGAGTVRTMPYPGFPTDAQAVIMAAACTARGISVIIENIFDSRFKHAGELCRLGASITTEGRAAVVEGKERLTGAPVSATDLRGGAALMVAGLAAEGVTEIGCLRHIDRGYQTPERVLRSLGASVTRTEDDSEANT